MQLTASDETDAAWRSALATCRLPANLRRTIRIANLGVIAGNRTARE